ncbi:hypothetical protein TSUD_363470 [Trifolium subterraneum]|uniref:Uncharacterized protein n=1 Tax=Trifolium subterraneum TaxID=3900 RepID=A0A2Z6MKQ0_TRISU|nr:hypothetical protein TSUD_363470 [Trifolium subterraneum]
MHNPKSAASFLIARAKCLQLRHHNYRFLTSTSRSLLFTPFISSRFFSGHCNIEQFSDDEYDCDFENHQASSTVANVDEWKWKLSMLLRNEKDQEIVSRDKRDRRDYEQIANLAKRMGLYSELFGKVVVASKVPLPNYRLDLDDKCPQREVRAWVALVGFDISTNSLGFTYPVRAHFLEDVLEITGYKLTSFNQVDDYGQDKLWKTQKQLAPRKRKNQITALVEDALSKSSFETYSPKTRDSLSSWAPDCIGFNLIEAVMPYMSEGTTRGLLQTCHGSMATSEQFMTLINRLFSFRDTISLLHPPPLLGVLHRESRVPFIAEF